MLKSLIKKTLAKAGYTVLRTKDHYLQDGVFTIHNDQFRRNALFREAYGRGLKASQGVDSEFEWRVHIALWAAAAALRVPGDFVECGVNAGFMSSAIMHALGWETRDRRFYLIDTFQGPVLDQFSAAEIEHGRRELAEKYAASGGYVTNLERIRANYSEWPNAVVVQGVVPNVLATLDINAVAFLHLDMNCAYPEQAALEHFWTRLSKGAMVLLDDYAFFGCEEQTRVLRETAGRLGAEILSLPTGQGLIIK